MRRVNIGELKARLSAHLRLVRKGEEVLVCDRNRPVARIIPVPNLDQSEHEKKMIAEGTLIPPKRRRMATDPWPKPVAEVPDEVMEEIWRREREGR